MNGKSLPHESSKGQAASQEAHSSARQVVGGMVTVAGAKEVNLSDPSADSLMQLETAVPDSGRLMAVSRLASGQVSVGNGLESAAAKSPAQSIGEQIRDSMQASLDRGERQVTIRLRPPELGNVLVRFREENEQIYGVVEVTRGDTRQEVEQALPQVLRSLQDSGIQIRRFEVTLADQPDENPGGQLLSEDQRPQQEGHGQYAHSPEGLPGADSSLESAEAQDSTDTPTNASPGGTSARRIDLLA